MLCMVGDGVQGWWGCAFRRKVSGGEGGDESEGESKGEGGDGSESEGKGEGRD